MSSENLTKNLYINANPSETRVAIVENGRLTEIHIDRRSTRGLVGNIYKGKVTRVLPGIQAAFVDIGTDKSAFLYQGDVIDPKNLLLKKSTLRIDDDNMLRSEITPERIDHALSPGQEILVQVIKDRLGTKGARISMFVSLAGRFLVLMPEFTHIALSRRITPEKKRSQLKKIIAKIKPDNFGVIIRTAAEHASAKQLEDDLNYLVQQYQEIERRLTKQPAPSLVYIEPNIAIKILRDEYRNDIDEILVDDLQLFEQLQSFMKNVEPGHEKKIKYYNEDEPLFDRYGIELDIARALNRKVWLPSGGYLVIDQAEALTAFDVNTGKFLGKLSAKETILKTNLEAVDEIVTQLRLRNIGGIIIIDFIDMEDSSDRQKVYEALENRLTADRARTTVLEISELGLVQMTRKRTRESLEHQLSTLCPLCSGNGHIRSVETLALDFLYDLDRYCLASENKKVVVDMRPEIKKHLETFEYDHLKLITKKHKIKLQIRAKGWTVDDLEHSDYEIIEE